MADEEIQQKDIFGTNRKKHYVFRSGDFYQVALFDYYESNVGKDISTFLNNKEHRLKDGDFSYRIINHWETVGLLSSERDSEKGWRKYSIIDIIWTQIIASLRQFGYPLEQILKVKKNLEMPEWENDLTQFPLLEFYIAAALIRRVAVYLLVFSNGEVEPVTKKEYLITADIMKLGNHIKISINDIIQKMYPKKDLSPIFKASMVLSHEEMNLLFMIRIQNFENIKIKTDDGKIERIEATEIIKNDRRIMNIISEGQYQDIEIKQSNGKVVSFKRTIKTKVEK